MLLPAFFLPHETGPTALGRIVRIQIPPWTEDRREPPVSYVVSDDGTRIFADSDEGIATWPARDPQVTTFPFRVAYDPRRHRPLPLWDPWGRDLEASSGETWWLGRPRFLGLLDGRPVIWHEGPASYGIVVRALATLDLARRHDPYDRPPEAPYALRARGAMLPFYARRPFALLGFDPARRLLFLTETRNGRRTPFAFRISADRRTVRPVPFPAAARPYLHGGLWDWSLASLRRFVIGGVEHDSVTGSQTPLPPYHPSPLLTGRTGYGASARHYHYVGETLLWSEPAVAGDARVRSRLTLWNRAARRAVVIGHYGVLGGSANGRYLLVSSGSGEDPWLVDRGPGPL